MTKAGSVALLYNSCSPFSSILVTALGECTCCMFVFFHSAPRLRLFFFYSFIPCEWHFCSCLENGVQEVKYTCCFCFFSNLNFVFTFIESCVHTCCWFLCCNKIYIYIIDIYIWTFMRKNIYVCGIIITTHLWPAFFYKQYLCVIHMQITVVMRGFIR